ncbi:MAG: hypothetical protein KAV00_10045 [Phycisphaerae bacterium]|nr:hypothetical protein [Phycisphaerae bacterium]
MGNAPAFLLTELQDLLEEQVRFARNGKAEEVSSLMTRVDELLAELSACPSLPRDNEQCEHIRRLYNELCLMLTAQKSELSERLKKMHTGKNSLRAYRSASSAR